MSRAPVYFALRALLRNQSYDQDTVRAYIFAEFLMLKSPGTHWYDSTARLIVHIHTLPPITPGLGH